MPSQLIFPHVSIVCCRLMICIQFLMVQESLRSGGSLAVLFLNASGAGVPWFMFALSIFLARSSFEAGAL